MKDTAALVLIACLFIALSVLQITLSAADEISVTVVEDEPSSSWVVEETESVGEQTININTASVDLLCMLPGIGETKAKAIVEYREKNGSFENVEELLNVNGIGEATLEKLKPYVELG